MDVPRSIASVSLHSIHKNPQPVQISHTITRNRLGIYRRKYLGRYAIRYHDDHRFRWDDVAHFIAFCFMFANVMVYEVTFDASYNDIVRAPCLFQPSSPLRMKFVSSGYPLRNAWWAFYA